MAIAAGALAALVGTGLANAGASIINATNSITNSYGNSSSTGRSESWSSSGQRTYGREATAQDIMNAQQANELNAEYARQQMEFNASEAEKARLWQENMSNTAYQRMAEDLKKAGFNPILALGTGGASTPTGAVATGGLQSAYKANSYAEMTGGSSGYSYDNLDTQSENKSESVSKTQGKGLLDAIGTAAKNVMDSVGKTYAKGMEILTGK